MDRLAFAVLLTIASAVSSAQGLKPLPSDLSQVPNLGIDKKDAVQFLDQLMQFSERKEENGLVVLSAKTPDGKIRVTLKCAAEKIVAGSLAIPTTDVSPSQQEATALKFAVLIRFMMNLVPEVKWDDPDTSPLGSIVGRMSRSVSERWTTKVGEKFIFATREAHPGYISFGVFNVQIGTEKLNIGDF